MNADSPHLTPDELSEYAARRPGAADVLRISDHLAECTACHGAMARLRGPSPFGRTGDFLTGAANGTPDFETLAGEVDGTLSPADHEDLAADLAHSAAAREALADLAAFRDELAALPVKHHRPGATVIAGPDGPPADNVITLPGPVWRRRGGWAWGLAALVVATAVGTWMFARPGQDPGALLRGSGGQVARLSGLPPDLRQAVETAAHMGQLPPPTKMPAAQRGVLAGNAVRRLMTVVAPSGSVVREQRPAMAWTPRRDATGYRVTVVPADGASLVTSPVLPADQTRWAPPDALPRGKTYQWQVEALRGEAVIDRAPKPPDAEARFEVLDAAGDRELKELEADQPNTPLVLGVAYWRAGLFPDAAEQFRRLAGAHAGSASAKRLAHAADDAAGADASWGTPASR